ncbi:MAG TPA: PAS domain S-box protein [Thermoanaerobaculia bacterium]|nr:PAS domain S-box protein [Thermoanaerobaculia bacterium]
MSAEPPGSVEQRLRAAVESSPSGLLMIDGAGRIVLLNREVERLFGYSREELLGQLVEILVPERFRDRHPGFREGFAREPRVRAMGAGRDLYGRRKDGSEVPVEIGLNPVATEAGFFVLSSVVDISARKQAEEERVRLAEQLRQSQKMEAVGRLAGGIAHDFNNILGMIVGYAQLARETAAEAEVVADLDEVLRAAERGRDLVQRILRFSRREELQPEAVDLERAVSEAIRLLRPATPAGVDIQLRADQRLPRVLADATSVHQVLMNLATNAVDAMPLGGRLQVDLRPFYARDTVVRSFPGLHEGQYVLLSVRDFGHGMDEATRARAVEPFFTTKGPGRGSGFGLATVHSIVQAHAGAMWIDSEVGAGTTVSCIFPALEEAEPAAQVSAEDLPRGRGERILFVDDEPALTRIGQRALERLGYRVTVAVGAAEALEAFRAAPEDFALLVTDYSMPEMHGVDLVRELTALRPGLPALLLSGYLEGFPEGELEAVGIRAVEIKPVEMATLARRVRALLDGASGPGDEPRTGAAAGS